MEKVNEPTNEPIILGVVSSDTKGGTQYPLMDSFTSTRKDLD